MDQGILYCRFVSQWEEKVARYAAIYWRHDEFGPKWQYSQKQNSVNMEAHDFSKFLAIDNRDV